MKRKIRNVFLALFVAGGIAGIYPSVSHAISIFFFNDVRPSDYFYDAVNDLVEREIIHGYEDNTFRPYQPVTRGQAAKILANVLNLDKQDVEDPGFKDVSKSNEYYGAIAALVKEGIIHGYPDGTFRPNEPIQRNHMAKIIARAFNIKASPGTKTPFTDLTNKEYVDYIRALYEYKITTGTTPTTFSGTDSVKRGQMVVFVYRAENAATDATINISEINGDTIIAGNKEYQIPRRLQTLFGLSGKESFKGATVKAKVIGGSIYSITSIEFGDLEEADKHAIDKQLPVLEINGKRPNGKYSVKNNHFAVQYGKISVSSQDPITLFSDQGAVIHYILSYHDPLRSEPSYYANLNSPVYNGPIKLYHDSYLHAVALKNGIIIGEMLVELDVVDDEAANLDPFPVLKVNGEEAKPHYSYVNANGISIIEQFVSAYEKATLELIPGEGTTIYLFEPYQDIRFDKIDFDSATQYTGPIENSDINAVIVRDGKVVGHYIVWVGIYLD